MTFGAFISTKRKDAKLNLRDAAKQLGIAYGYLCDIEQGRRPAPEGEFVERISSFWSWISKSMSFFWIWQQSPDSQSQRICQTISANMILSGRR